MAVTEVRTAVFPVAGRGTRFLPATKASPKEMLPIVDKPLIQYAVDEALAAGARRLVFITGSSKRAIEDHFDTDDALEKLLDSQGKHELAEQVRSVLPSYASCIYIRQPAPLGLGAFAMTTLALSLFNANVWPAAIFPALAAALLGLVVVSAFTPAPTQEHLDLFHGTGASEATAD